MVTDNQQNDKQLRITFVLGSLTAGGAEKVASFIINSLDTQSHQVSLISRRGPEEDFFSLPDSVERIVLGGEGESGNKWVGLLKNVQYVRKLRRALKITEPDIVISFLTRPNIYTIIASVGLGKRVIISERNDTTRQKHEWPWEWLRSKLYNFADVVTANSENALRGMQDYVAARKLVFVPNPVIIPDKISKPHLSVRMINVGRLTKVKNQGQIINAFSKILEEESNWVLEFFGDGEEREILQKQILEKDLPNKVILHGLVSDIEQYYQRAAIFVLASDFEGTPNALLEAMAHGLPCIVPDSLPGALNLIENNKNGLVFRSNDELDLAEKMRTLVLNPSLRKKIGEEARTSIEQFSPDYIIQIWNNIIE